MYKQTRVSKLSNGSASAPRRENAPRIGNVTDITTETRIAENVTELDVNIQLEDVKRSRSSTRKKVKEIKRSESGSKPITKSPSMGRKEATPIVTKTYCAQDKAKCSTDKNFDPRR